MKKKPILKIIVILMLLISVGCSTYIVSANEPFVLKWTATTGVTVSSGINPLAVDINHDGIMEIFVSGDRSPNADKIYCFSGDTGKLIWSKTLSYSIGPHCPMEIYDLNNDGKYEVIQPGPNALEVLHAEDGSPYWHNSAVKCSEAYQLVLDTDKNGYPYIYTCNADDTSPYTGMLRKVDGRTGRVLISKSIYYPCHGGLSAADVDNDGDFEIFMSDRNTGNGKGIQCYDAETLNLLWNRRDIYCSSHLPVIADVNNDGILDVIVSQQRDSNAGIYCLDGRTGDNIPGKCQNSISGLASHETFPVYDVDGDGRLELATCCGDDVKIFDLGSWKIEATLSVDGKPPYYANVMGDGNLEIIFSEEVSSILIYDNQYHLVYTIPKVHSQGSIVSDIDEDGLNELVEISDDGTVRAYDTYAVASNPLPRTNTPNYSERNTRTAVYISPPGETSGNQAPIISNPNPTNGLSNVPISLSTLSIVIRDPNADTFAYTIQTNPSIGSQSIQSDKDGIKTCAIAGLTYSTTYHWYVNATDGKSWTRQSYTFKTASASGNSPPVFSGMIPTNNSANIPISTSSISLTIKDPEGKSFNYTIQTRPNVGSASVKNVIDGTKSCTISGLKYSTTYRWYVNATDGTNWKRCWYTFTTAQNPAINPFIFSEANPSNGATNIPISTSKITLTVQNYQNHSFDINIKTSPSIGSTSLKNVHNGIKTLKISGLTYGTTYHWYVSCKDVSNGQWTNQSYTFTTESDPANSNPPSPPSGGGTSLNETEPPSISEQNNPPNPPTTPVGKTSIEPGIIYIYNTTVIDPDGDQVRLQFDWGDGNLSDWSEFVDSNTTVSSSHSWSSLSNYSISVIAQDPNGSNSNWSIPLTINVSDPLTVNVSEQESNIEPPILEVIVPRNGSTNQIIIFSASGSIAPDGEIISYVWDFGDGKIKTGNTVSHSYIEPGVYVVNLTVIDSTEKTLTQTFHVIIDNAYAEVKENAKSFSSSYLGITLIFIGCAVCIGILIFFRKKVSDVPSSITTVHNKKRIEQLDEKIALFTRTLELESKEKIYPSNIWVTSSISHNQPGMDIKNKIDDSYLAKIRETIDKKYSEVFE